MCLLFFGMDCIVFCTSIHSKYLLPLLLVFRRSIYLSVCLSIACGVDRIDNSEPPTTAGLLHSITISLCYRTRSVCKFIRCGCICDHVFHSNFQTNPTKPQRPNVSKWILLHTAPLSQSRKPRWYIRTWFFANWPGNCCGASEVSPWRDNQDEMVKWLLSIQFIWLIVIIWRKWISRIPALDSRLTVCTL